jgi:hypothetical protein
MALKSNAGKGGDYMPGVFVNKRLIKDVANVTGETTFPSDVAIALFFDTVTKKNGETFEPKMTIYGDFEKDANKQTLLDPSGAPQGWGSAFKIDRLINQVGGWNGELASKEIPDEALLPLIGKTVYTLQYASKKEDGTKVMKDYQIVARETEFAKGAEIDGGVWLLENFRKQVADQKIRNYFPDANGNGNGPVAAAKEDPGF